MTTPTPINRRHLLQLLGGGAAATLVTGVTGCGGGGGSQLRLSHQWPESSGQEGDFRSQIAQRFADQVGRETNGEVEVRIYPNASLVGADEQYRAVAQGTIDMTLLPIAYAVGQHPAFAITDLPCLVKNHTQARNWQDAEIGARVESIFERNGSKILVWNWNSFCLGRKQGPPVVRPGDIRPGEVWRGGSPQMEAMLERTGASITSMPSSEVYSALQTGVVSALATSPASFRSYRLYEQTASYTSPTRNTLGFYFEPLLIGLEQYRRLPGEVQQAFDGAGSALQDFAYEASAEDDRVTERRVRQAGDTIATIDDAAFADWARLAPPVWDRFVGNIPNGRQLLELAQQVPQT
ncbi:MAG: C4-dicarboxylate ABC transporter substrate-binding protein [Pseudonocardiaceae bacterium]|nr:C4-dicarboxylate ABC transporter substrate-binding protein [Pseudonocardiaceae bacterium]